MGVVTASAVRRLRVRPAGAARSCGARARVRQRVPVVRLVLRGQHRPDLDPARHARARAACWSPSRPAGSTRSAQARRQVRKGTQLVVTGGVDALALPVGLGGPAGQRPAQHRRRPGRAYLPFDADAPRLRAGRGRRDPGRRRTPTPRPSAGPPDLRRDRRLRRDVRPPARLRPRRRACAGRPSWRWPTPGCAPADIDVVFADARRRRRSWTGSRPRRSPRSSAPRGVPVTAPKTMTGRLYAGGAPLDVAAALLSIRRRGHPAHHQRRQPAAGLRPRPGARRRRGRHRCAPRWSSPGATAGSTPPWSLPTKGMDDDRRQPRRRRELRRAAGT